MGYKRNYNSLLPDDFVLSEEFETIIEQKEKTKDQNYITGKPRTRKTTNKPKKRIPNRTKKTTTKKTK